MKQVLFQIEPEAITNTIKSSLKGLTFIIALSYLAILLPISYLNVSSIKPVWNSVVYSIWTISCLFGGWYFIEYFITGRENELFDLLSLLGFMFLLGLTVALKLIGLVPIRFFIPTVMAFSLSFT